MDNKILALQERRDFLVKAASMLGVVICGCAEGNVLTSCSANPTGSTGVQLDINMAQITGLSAIGSGVSHAVGTNNGGRNVIIVRIAADTSAQPFLVVTSVCTHEGFAVYPPTSAGGNMVCSGHSARFSATNGNVVSQGGAGGGASNLQVFSSSYNATTKILTITF